jgi:transposase-like protein
LAVISKRHELHPNQISDWKKQFMYAAPTLFEAAHKVAPASADPDVALLYEQIGRLQMEPHGLLWLFQTINQFFCKDI